MLAAGNPFGLGARSRPGIVSARGRDIGAGPFDDFLQLDAPINPGNSGGPTFNMRGQVVAREHRDRVADRRLGRDRLRGAERDRPAGGDDLREKGRIDRGWLGVSISDDQTCGAGVRIATVDRHRAGSAAPGCDAGDVDHGGQRHEGRVQRTG